MLNRTTTRLTLALALVPLLSFAACQQQPTPTPQTSPQASPQTRAANEWETFVKDFLEAYFVAHPDTAVLAGRHEFDGKLPDWSPEGIKREIARLHSLKERAAGFADASLDERQRFERDYLVARIDGDLFWLESAEWPFRNPQFYAGSLDPNVYVSREYAPLDARLRAYTAYAKNIPAAAAQVRSNLRTPLPRSYVAIGRTSFGGLATYFEKDVPTVFASVQDAPLQTEFRTANEAAIKAMKELDAWFAAQEATATDNFALGPEKFSEMLRATERVDVPLDKLEEIGRSDMERNVNALNEACATYAPSQTVEQCIAKSRGKKPQGGPVEGARRQLDTLKAFLGEKNLVSIPGTEQAKVAESPPYQRWNFAYIDIPGPYETGLASIYYIAPPDPAWSPKEREEYVPGESDLLFTSVHEVWPGHFLQFLHANRSPSKFGQVFVGYAFAEGWAHYTEEMMWDAGLGNGDPETHIGQLLNALLRNGRFLSAIGMHTGKMTVADSERLFREKGYQDAGTARQQAARGTFDPAYLNYTMGKLMIRKLREDWTVTRGGREGWRAFHDEFLKYGGPPVPLVRNAMLGGNAGPPF
ncbi:MAG TPA: DUF885 domain-containing protein [Pyrinomonadaceae bacterium]|jgi:hypothetical protein|nr:DUF885 domain-containing protein [Pyrinomonadaceae bacterium]